jgi:hypothetical protein
MCVSRVSGYPDDHAITLLFINLYITSGVDKAAAHKAAMGGPQRYRVLECGVMLRVLSD